MITESTRLKVADNSGARTVMCFRVIGQRKRTAKVGDVIRVAVKEAQSGGMVKKGQVLTAVVVRTVHPLKRKDGTSVKFDNNACVIIDAAKNPIGSRIFGPVARELREMNYMKVISLAPEVL